MTKKFHILILIITIGFFLMPALASACEMKSERPCCSKEVSVNKEKKECCKAHKQASNKEQKGACNGKCGHSNCTTSSVQYSLAFFEILIQNNNFDFSENQHNYFNSEANLSSGFYSIWLIPKIS